MSTVRCSCGRRFETKAALHQHWRAKGCGTKAIEPRTRTIFCCACATDVEARLTDGREVYPHRTDIAGLPFWRCPGCGNTVGCHHKTANRTKPLGSIPGPEMKRARSAIHAILDPMWKSGRFRRRDLYARLSGVLGREYHTGELRTLDEARQVYRAVQAIAAERVPEAAHG